jgi:hypothetical protein
MSTNPPVPPTPPTPTSITPLTPSVPAPPSPAPSASAPAPAPNLNPTDRSPLSEQARAEYDRLKPVDQGKLHQLLNEIESREQITLAGLHGFFGAKK